MDLRKLVSFVRVGTSFWRCVSMEQNYDASDWGWRYARKVLTIKKLVTKSLINMFDDVWICESLSVFACWIEFFFGELDDEESDWYCLRVGYMALS